MNHIFKPLLLAGVALSWSAIASAQPQTWVTRNADGTTTRTQVTLPYYGSQTHGVDASKVTPHRVHPDDPNRNPKRDGNTTIIINNGGGGYYGNPGYGYPGYGYGYPTYPFPYTIPIGPVNPRNPFPPPTITSIPIGGYNPYPDYGYGYPSYPDYGYGYPNDGYGDYGYGYNTQTTGGTFSYNRGGVGVTIGGGQTTGTYTGVYNNGGYNGYNNGAANFGAPVGGFGRGTVTFGNGRRRR